MIDLRVRSEEGLPVLEASYDIALPGVCMCVCVSVPETEARDGLRGH